MQTPTDRVAASRFKALAEPSGDDDDVWVEVARIAAKDGAPGVNVILRKGIPPTAWGALLAAAAYDAAIDGDGSGAPLAASMRGVLEIVRRQFNETLDELALSAGPSDPSKAH